MLENVTDQNGPNFQNGQNGRKISDQNGQNGRNGAERESGVDGKSGNKVSLRKNMLFIMTMVLMKIDIMTL